MEKTWQELCDVLADMLSAYQKLLELGLAKKEALVGARIKDVESITKREETLIIFITHSEKVRKAVMAKIAEHYNLPPEEMNLSKIQKITDDEMTGKLEEIELDFHKVLSDLESLNKVNNELIQQALKFVNYNINILTQSAASPAYAPQGQGGHAAQSRAIFDRKV